MCRVMKFKSYPKGSVIFQEDGISDGLYLVLTGAVNVFVCKSPKEIEKEKEWVKERCEITEIELDPETRKAKRKDSSAESSSDKGKKDGPSERKKRKVVAYKMRKLVFNSVQKKYLEDLTLRDTYQVKEELETSESETESANDETPSGANKEKKKTQFLEDLVRDSVSSSDDDFAYDNDAEAEIQCECEFNKAKKLLYKFFGEIDPECIENKEQFFTNGIRNIALEVALDSGYAFGDFGMRNKPLKSKVIICKEDCQFGIVNAEDYKGIVKVVQERKHRERVNFVELNMFPEATREVATLLVKHMKKERMTKNQRLYTEKEMPVKLFLIKEGEVEVISLT